MADREKATLIVGGGKFEDFTSIWVQDTWGDAFSQFKFTCAEREGSAGGVATLSSSQFEPGTRCQILLAGRLAITGIILTRQVAYDAHDHGVVLSGANETWESETSSIVHKTSSFDGKSFIEIATEVFETTDATVDVEGELDNTEFKTAQCFPGEPIFTFLERLARDRNVRITCNPEGHVVLVGKGGGNGSQGQLIEGQNILKMQCVTSIQQERSEYMTRGHINGDNKKNGRDASEQEARKDGALKGKINRPQIVPIEQGVERDKELEMHAENLAQWADLDHLQATITVQGWQPEGPGGGELWTAGSDVKVKAPMAGLDATLSIQSVTFTQDNQRGSLTTLVCVMPSGLKGGRSGEFKRDTPPARVDKGPARTGSK